MRTERVLCVNNLDTIHDLFERVGHEATFELYHVIVRPTEDHKILIFKIVSRNVPNFCRLS